MEDIVKVQRRLNRTFVTIPHKFAKDIVDVMHMKVSKDEKGRLVYEAV